jgi:endoglucanase Acf2
VRLVPVVVAAVIAAGAVALAARHDERPPLGLARGSLATAPPESETLPPAPAFVVPELHAPIPTNQWWSSLVALPFSERQYPHPLAVAARAEGFQIRYPGPDIRADEHCICGWMDFEPPNDLILSNSAVARFDDARLAGYSDWFVTARFAAPGKADAGMDVSYGHGSPFVFATLTGGDPIVRFPAPPEVFHESSDGSVVGVCRDRRCWLLVGAVGSRWTGMGSASLTNAAAEGAQGTRAVTIALLPDGQRTEPVALFTRLARNRVRDTTVTWSYDEARARVRAHFGYALDLPAGAFPATLFALYPHQWTALVGDAAGPEIGSYESVRGRMSLRASDGFDVEYPFPGVLPALPVLPGSDVEALRALVRRDAEGGSHARDTYWAGKELGRLATLQGLARQLGLDPESAALQTRLRTQLEAWFDGRFDPADPSTGGAFLYDQRWGTLIGYPSSYGSAAALNDHHFHYGYFLRAAAAVGLRDPAWLGADRYGPFVKLLARDVASGRRGDDAFPFFRNFDPYAGHSWAAGDGVAGDGNNQESSSEAMAAWTGFVLLGEITGDRALRDLGAFLYASELAAIEAYWFDVTGANFPPSYPAEVVPMIWGGKGAYGTYFSGEPEHLYGINWLPYHGGSLYLGRFPDYAKRSYDALVRARGSTDWKTWQDVVVMYRALSDPTDAARQWSALAPTVGPEAGNARSNVAQWISIFALAGDVDRSVAADTPLYAVFRKNDERTYVAYNARTRPTTVQFSDGARLAVEPGAFAVVKGPAR